MPAAILPEIAAMQTAAMAIAKLTPAERRRVAAWLTEYAEDLDAMPTLMAETDVQTSAAADEGIDTPVTPELDAATHEAVDPSSFGELYELVAPRTGAQKAVVAGWWLQNKEAKQSWKAFEVNKLLKSIDVRVSSISIVLTNAVKAARPMIEELGRTGNAQRSRKTFCLTSAGTAYVEQALA